MIHVAIATLAFLSGLNAFAYNDQNPNDDWNSCPPGFSRDVFGTCAPDYTFPGGQGHDDDGTPHGSPWGGGGNGGSHWGGGGSIGIGGRGHTCYASDRRGRTFAGTSLNLKRAQQRAMNACEDNSARPASCRLAGCN